ncbi:MAG: division/cell wall cluster transcriptional repressor MraZ [Synergistaceae bacterium]|nr:division/cell wall cluster transcriptional repressor MraZ [Synergistaceae bacterium]
MLMGTFEHRLDTKARLVLPMKFRERLGDMVIAAFGMEHCVSLYTQDEWEKLIEWLSSGSFLSNERTRKLQRIILSSAHDLAIDGAGRILLPTVLRDYASLEQDVVINGVKDHAEIWDRARWTEYWKGGVDILQELAGGQDSDA